MRLDSGERYLQISTASMPKRPIAAKRPRLAVALGELGAHVDLASC
jgi:hypothetical protein